MKTSNARNGSSQTYISSLACTLAIAGALISAASVLAAPRVCPVLGLFPESPPLFQESFDEGFVPGMTNAQVTLGDFTYVESWSCYALQRAGNKVMPFVVPGVEATGHTNIDASQQTFRFWFKPYWTSGAGPGVAATLLELDAIGKNESANVWSLQVSGTMLSLIAQSDGKPTLLLKTEISWQANESHLIALDCSAKATALFVDGQPVGQGEGTAPVPPQMTVLVVGSSLAGDSVADGDFDELFCFGPPAASRFARPSVGTDSLFYYNFFAPYVALGPLSAEEIAAREKRMAARKAQSGGAGVARLLALGARQTCGPLGAGACVTNGPVFMTNVVAGFESDGTMTVVFDLVGGTQGPFYDIYTTTNLGTAQWTWLARGPTCHTYQFTNQPGSAAFYKIGPPLDFSGENRIQTENVITGTTNWMLFNPISSSPSHGWPTNDADTLPEIQGFASATSVNVGDTIGLYVDVRATNNPAATNFTLEIFRLGWYGGRGGRQMTWSDNGAKTNVTLTSHQQPVPKMNPTNGLIDCLSGWTTNGVNTNQIWQRSYALTIPTNWVSGVYVGKLTTGTDISPQTTGKQSYLIFIVREDGRTSEFLYQASVTTWQAYNGWGGSSTYPYPSSKTCSSNIPNAVLDHAETVSFNRPYTPGTCPIEAPLNLRYGSGAGEFLTMTAAPAWEYNMVRWLERQGYDVTYSTSVDTHRGSPISKGVKAFLSVGHDEYWSAPMRANLEAARDRGVNLAFFASNVCYWQIQFKNNESAFSVDKTPSSEGSYGQWRGPVINNHESSLVGEEFFAINGFSPQNITMPANFPSGSGIGGYHWAYDYSGLTNGQVLPGLLGYEADGCLDMNLCFCFQTPFPLSPCPGSNTVKLAETPIFCVESTNCSYPGITNGHSYVTIYSACNGAQVFATGSMQWSWGLDGFASDIGYPFSYRVHPAAQQMTHNVLRTFSGRPTAPVIFANADSATSGNWTNLFSAEGYWIANTSSLTNLPAYAQVTMTNQSVQVWTNSTTDTRALLIPNSSNRIASAWTTINTQGSSFTIDLNLTDTNKHSVALYCVDWLGTGTILEKLEIFDSNDTSFSHPLDTRSFQLPPNGVYLVWSLRGHNILRVTKSDSASGTKAMVSGLFFGVSQ